MNIGLLIYDLRSGGAERILCKWSDLLNENHNITLYTFDGSSKPEYSYSGKLAILNLPSKGKNRLKQLQMVVGRSMKLRRRIKADNINMLISFCSTANFPAMFQQVNTIASIRLYSEYFSYQKIYRFLICHTKTELMVQTNRLKKDILLDVGEKYSSKIHVLANPVDVVDIRNKMQDSLDDCFLKAIRGKKVICFTASFKTSKNHWNLIKSFNLLHKEMPETVLLLIGGNGELEAKIRKMVEESIIKNSVIFVGKTMNPFKYERQADLFVLPSLFEGIPNVLLEAMAVGLPVIATDCPSGPREILYTNPNFNITTKGIEQADFGLLVEQFSPIPNFEIDCVTEQNYILKNAMKNVLTDHSLNLFYREKAILRSSKYDLNEYKHQLDNLIHKCWKGDGGNQCGH